jgi:hypothetical protein
MDFPTNESSDLKGMVLLVSIQEFRAPEFLIAEKIILGV